MKTVKTARLTKNEIVQLYWLDFLHEVADNFVPKAKNGYASSDTWGIEPTENEFNKWLIKSGKLTEIDNLPVSAKEDITEGSDGEVEAEQEPKVDEKRSNK